MLKLILFDLDGTLVDTHIDYEKIREEITKFFRENGLEENWEFKPLLSKIDEAALLLGEGRLGDSEKKREEAYKILADMELSLAKNSSFFPDVQSTLRTLQLKGLKIGVFSRNSKKLVDKILEKLGVKFDFVFARELNTKPKPNPEGIFLAMEKLKVLPEETLLVGDQVVDIEAGKRAGIRTAGVLTGVGTEAALRSAGAEIILKNFSELLSL